MNNEIPAPRARTYTAIMIILLIAAWIMWLTGPHSAYVNTLFPPIALSVAAAGMAYRNRRAFSDRSASIK